MSLEGWPRRGSVAEDDSDSDRTDDEGAPTGGGNSALPGRRSPPWHTKFRIQKEWDDYSLGVGPKPRGHKPASPPSEPEKEPLHLQYSMSPEAIAAREAQKRLAEARGFTLDEGPAPAAPLLDKKTHWIIGGSIMDGLPPLEKKTEENVPNPTPAYVPGQNMSEWIPRRRPARGFLSEHM